MTRYDFNNLLLLSESHGDSLTERILQNLPGISVKLINGGSELQNELRNNPSLNSKKTLILRKNRGKFLKRCPGTKEFICCNYHVINNVLGCPINCAYCVLDSYLDFNAITIFTNLDDFYREFSEFKQKNKFFRVGTGELSDSLAIDDLTHFSFDLTSTIDDDCGGLLEFKTKSSNIDNLLTVRPSKRIVVGLSLNTEWAICNFEKGASIQSERINSLKILSEYGYSISIHFDPIIIYDGCEREYCNLIDKLFCSIKNNKSIAWISMGGLRFGKEQKDIMKREQVKLLQGEFVRSRDGKYRYFKPERINLYRTMIRQIKKYGQHIPVYLCMESMDVWEEVCGNKPSSIEELHAIF